MSHLRFVCRGLGALGMALLAAAAIRLASGQSAPAGQPITTLTDETGQLLKKWAAEGTAAGNVGDQYDNRDRGHSGFHIEQFPQFSTISYTQQQRKANQDWGAQSRVLPGVVMGNSSTASEVTAAGSNPRLYYSDPNGLAFLTGQYIRNNLYIYPAHHDHLIGHDGNPLTSPGAYGDLFPTNTPFLIISQWSSFSDQPFMQAVAATLAAFRPEVKARLVKEGLLMPTVQMILRMNYGEVKKEEDYLTAAAHPTVFDGTRLNMAKMVEMAHAITLETIPPFVQLRVIEDRPARAGRDYFDAAPSEMLADSPFVIARIFRSTDRVRRIVLSAEGSGDINHRPLTCRWVVVRGDPEQVKIEPLNAAGNRVAIEVPYHPWAPIAPGSPWGSNRVDIGVVVHNRAYYSAPAFVTDFTLDSEGRTYGEDGRILEVGYGMTESFLPVGNYASLLEGVSAEKPSPVMALLSGELKPQEREALRDVAARYQPAQARLEAAQRYQREANASKVEADIKNANNTLNATTAAVNEILTKTPPGMAVSPKVFFEQRLAALLSDPELTIRHAALLAELLARAPTSRQAVLQAERKRLVALGIIKDQPGMAIELTPLRAGDAPLTQRLTDYEQACLARFNGEVLATLFYPDAIRHVLRVRYVDARLSAGKEWRDIYHYDAAGQLIGWTRYALNRTMEFTRDGYLVVAQDAAKRCLKAREVRYERKLLAPNETRPRGAEDRLLWATLEMTVTDKQYDYTYDGPNDRVGRAQPTAR